MNNNGNNGNNSDIEESNVKCYDVIYKANCMCKY